MSIKPEHYFWLKDGTAIKDLNNLAEAFQKMHDDIFKHHVNNQRNDFSNWIKDVLKDKELANKIAKAQSSKEMHKHIRRNLDQKNKKTETKEKKKEITSLMTKNKTQPRKIQKKPKKEKKDNNPKKEKLKFVKKIKFSNKSIIPKKNTILNKLYYLKKKFLNYMNYLIRDKREFLLGLVFGIAVGIIIARYVS